MFKFFVNFCIVVMVILVLKENQLLNIKILAFKSGLHVVFFLFFKEIIFCILMLNLKTNILYF